MKNLICSLYAMLALACSDSLCRDVGCRDEGLKILFSPQVPSEGEYKLQIKLNSSTLECLFNVPDPVCKNLRGDIAAFVHNSEIYLVRERSDRAVLTLYKADETVKVVAFDGIEYKDVRAPQACVSCEYAEVQMQW